MATYYTDYGTAQHAALKDGSKSPTVRVFGGDVRYLDVKITVLAGITTSDAIKLARLPKGARLVPALCSVDHADPGDAFTCKIGDSADDDRYGAGLALGNAAGRKAFSEATTKGDAFLNPYVFTGEDWVTVVPTTVTSAVEHVQVWHLAYALA